MLRARPLALPWSCRSHQVYHGSANRLLLHDYARAYLNAVEDGTRAMLRLKALYRARAIPVAGEQVYSAEQRTERLVQLGDRGARLRAELLMATMATPWRFRTKRNLWGYAGLAVVSETSAEYAYVGGRPVRRRRKPLTRGLNKNYNRFLKNVSRGCVAGSHPRYPAQPLS